MRKRHPAAFKAQIVQQVLKEDKTISQIASENGIHPNQISTWKAAALKGLPTLFEREKAEVEQRATQEAHERQLQELYVQIGKLTTQVAWLKKIWPRTSVETSDWLLWNVRERCCRWLSRPTCLG